MAFDVFISYSSLDKPTADAACAMLESLGIRCWIAPRDIMPGSEYGAAIVEAIHQSRVLVLVFSSHANQSPQIGREVERAVSRGIPIVPLRIENITPTQSLEYFIGTVHWLDALTPPVEQHLHRLGEAVRALLRIDSPAASGGSAAAPPVRAVQPPIGAATIPTAGMWWRHNRIVLGIVGACCVFGAMGGLWYLKSGGGANAAECERLWIARNSFYKSHGYCFQTQRAKDHFGNTGCTYNDQDHVYQQVFSDDERTQVQNIRNDEKARGCQ
jgi:TIR domain-containing protein/YARHG domain-containing protein